MEKAYRQRIEKSSEDYDGHLSGSASAFTKGAECMWNNLWIPVDEQLPENDTDVFVRMCLYSSSGEFVTIHGVAQRYPSGEWYVDGMGFVMEEITHWMPIPPNQ